MIFLCTRFCCLGFGIHFLARPHKPMVLYYTFVRAFMWRNPGIGTGNGPWRLNEWSRGLNPLLNPINLDHSITFHALSHRVLK